MKVFNNVITDGNENSPIYYKGINLEKEQIKEVDSVVSISYLENLLYKATINLSELEIKAEGVLKFNNIPLENTPLSDFSDYIEDLTFYVFNPKSENLNLDSGFILKGFFQIKINYNGIMYYRSDSILVVDLLNTDTQLLEKLDIYFAFSLS